MDELVDVGCAVGAGFIYDAAGAEVQDCVHSDVPFDSFFVAGIGAHAVTEGTHVTIETNLDNDAVSTCSRVGTRRAASRSPCDGRRCGGRRTGFEERRSSTRRWASRSSRWSSPSGPPLCDGSRVAAFAERNDDVIAPSAHTRRSASGPLPLGCRRSSFGLDRRPAACCTPPDAMSSNARTARSTAVQADCLAFRCPRVLDRPASDQSQRAAPKMTHHHFGLFSQLVRPVTSAAVAATPSSGARPAIQAVGVRVVALPRDDVDADLIAQLQRRRRRPLRLIRSVDIVMSKLPVAQ